MGSVIFSFLAVRQRKVGQTGWLCLIFAIEVCNVSLASHTRLCFCVCVFLVLLTCPVHPAASKLPHHPTHKYSPVLESLWVLLFIIFWWQSQLTNDGWCFSPLYFCNSLYLSTSSEFQPLSFMWTYLMFCIKTGWWKAIDNHIHMSLELI